MKKHGLNFVLVLMMALICCGCGSSNEHLTTDLSAKEQLTVDEMITLLESKDFKVVKEGTLDDDIDVYQINDEQLLLVRDFGTDYLNRNNTAQKIGWSSSAGFTPPVVEKAIADYGIDSEHYGIAQACSAKNLLAYYIPYWGTTDETGKASMALLREMTDVFLYDINGLQHTSFLGQSENFELRLMSAHYQTPLAANDATFYEQYREYQLQLKLSEKVLQQYKGESLSVVIDGPYAIADASFSIGVDSESLNVQLGPKKEFVGDNYEGDLQLKVTITVGDLAETIDLVPEKPDHALE